MENFIRVAKANEKNLPFKATTFYKWFHVGKNLQIFTKVGGALFVDTNELSKLMENGKQNEKNVV